MGALTVPFVSNAQLDREKQASQSATVTQLPIQLAGLSGHIERFWQSAYSAKTHIHLTMLRNLRQRMGIYEPTTLQEIRDQGGSEIYMMLTQGKCRGAESWLREIVCNEIDPPWGLDPTPMPDLPPGVTQAIIGSIAQQAIAAGWEIDDTRIDDRLIVVKDAAMRKIKAMARKLADRHELVIAEQFAKGGWEQALSDFIYELVTFPAAFIKGPMRRMAKSREWVQDGTGAWVADVKRGIRPEWERRSPFDIFPAPAMVNLQRGNLIDRYRFTRESLEELDGVEGYSSDCIHAALEQYGDKGYRSTLMGDTERAILELRPNEQMDHEGTMETHNFWGTVSGSMLLEWGYTNNVDPEEMANQRIEPFKQYQIEAWKIGHYVIKAQINPDPLGMKPYSKCSFEEIPGAFWGQGLPEIIRDCQGMCNGAARALANNAGIASGPQVDINVERLADGEPVTKPYPWKVYQTTNDPGGQNVPAVRFWQANMNVQELLAIYGHFERVADNVSGFPAYSYGDGKVGGAGRTSSGLAQMLGNVGRGVKRVVSAIDRTTVKFHVTGAFNYNMQYSKDPMIKGQLVAVPKGAAAVLIKEQVAQRQQAMLQATLNPIDAQIIGTEGRREMLRPALKNAEFDVDSILPTDDELALRTAGMPQPHELLASNQGPNSPATPGGAPGMGGTPAAPAATDVAGNPSQGMQQRQINQGHADGGMVRRRGDDLDHGV